MTSGIPLPPPPGSPPVETLTREQVVQLVNAVSPDAFYQRAEAFDRGARRLQDVLDQVRYQQNRIQEAMTGRTSDDLDTIARDVSGRIGLLLQVLQSPGYGTMLRKAGDALAAHQRRLADLQAQKGQQDSAPPVPGGPSREQLTQSQDQAAQQVLRDLSTAYQDITYSLAPLPYNDPRVKAGAGGGVVNSGSSLPGSAPATGGGGGMPGGAPLGGGVLMTAFSTGAPGAGGGGSPYGMGMPPFSPVLGRSGPTGSDRGGQVPSQPMTNGVVGQGGSGGGPGPSSGFGVPLVPGIAGGGPAVLGRRERPRSETHSGIPSREGSVLGKKEQRKVSVPDEHKVVADPPASQPLNRVETMSAGLTTAAQAIGMAQVKTTVDTPNLIAPPAPQTGPAGHTVSAVAGQAPSPQGTPPPATPPPPGQSPNPNSSAPPPSVAPPTQGTQAPPVSHGLASAPPPGPIDPEKRGMSLPGGTTTGGAPPGVGRGAGEVLPNRSMVEPVPPGGGQHGAPMGGGGYPMSPMMGGMGGQGSQQNERLADVPSESRPEFHELRTDEEITLGRRIPEPVPEPADQGATQIEEQLSELDRLLERGK